MIKWPKKAASALQKLFEPLQEIDVYVEDENDEVFYRCLFNSACDGKITIARVFSLGGRRNVIAAARAHDQAKRRALFVTDGDLEWVRGLSVPPIAWLHQHSAYCVENLLICERALSLIISQELIVGDEDARRRVDLDEWRASVMQPLVELFLVFATAQELAPHLPTVAIGVLAVCSGGKKVKPVVDPAKISAVVADIKSKVEAAASPSDFASVYTRICTRVSSLADPLMIVSGKDFLIPLINFRMQSIGCQINRRTLRMRLVMSGEMDRFSQLRDALYAVAKS